MQSPGKLAQVIIELEMLDPNSNQIDRPIWRKDTCKTKSAIITMITMRLMKHKLPDSRNQGHSRKIKNDNTMNDMGTYSLSSGKKTTRAMQKHVC